MPLKRCEGDGWKYGDSGKCYHGPDAKKKAIKQAIAIVGPDKFKKEIGALDTDSLEVLAEMSMIPYNTLPKFANPDDPPQHADKDRVNLDSTRTEESEKNDDAVPVIGTKVTKPNNTLSDYLR